MNPRILILFLILTPAVTQAFPSDPAPLESKVLEALPKAAKGKHDSLAKAAAVGDLAAARYFVEKKKSPINDKVALGRLDGTPLLHAARAGKLEAVVYLVNKGADLEATAGGGPTAVFLALSHPPVVDYLIAKGANVKHTFEDMSLLHEATFEGQLSLVTWLVESKKLDVNWRLVPGGATPICAMSHKAPPVQAYLMKMGADVKGPVCPGGRGLANSAAEASQHDLLKLVLKWGASPNGSAYLTTPLHAAVGLGDADTVKILLAAGADKTRKGEEGKTPYELAVEFKNDQLAKLLKP